MWPIDPVTLWIVFLPCAAVIAIATTLAMEIYGSHGNLTKFRMFVLSCFVLNVAMIATYLPLLFAFFFDRSAVDAAVKARTGTVCQVGPYRVTTEQITTGTVGLWLDANPGDRYGFVYSRDLRPLDHVNEFSAAIFRNGWALVQED
jgi:hypothetical protein